MLIWPFYVPYEVFFEAHFVFKFYRCFVAFIKCSGEPHSIHGEELPAPRNQQSDVFHGRKPTSSSPSKSQLLHGTKNTTPCSRRNERNILFVHYTPWKQRNYAFLHQFPFVCLSSFYTLLLVYIFSVNPNTADLRQLCAKKNVLISV